MGYLRNIRGGLGPDEWPSVLDHALALIVRRAKLLSAGIRVARPFINEGATWFVSGGCLTGTWPRQEARKFFVVADHRKCYVWYVLNLAKKRIGPGDRTFLQGEEQLADEEFQLALNACDVHDAKQRTCLKVGTLSAVKDHNEEDFSPRIGSSGSGSSGNDLWRRRG